jgi:hypothetical protein
LVGGKASPKKLKLAERRDRAIVLRQQGETFEQIANKIAREFPYDFPDYNKSMAFKDVMHEFQALHQQNLEEVEALRQLESERLDKALLAIAQRVEEGNLQAIDRWLKIIHQRCLLWGLYLPATERPKAEAAPTGIELEIIAAAHPQV